EILGRKEGKTTDCSDRAHPASFGVLRPDRLCRIFDDLQVKTCRELHQRIHVCRLTVEMHRHERAHATTGVSIDESSLALLTLPGEELFYSHRRNIECAGVDVDIDGPRAHACNGPASRKKSVRARDHFIAWPDIERHERDQQCIGARREANRELSLAVVGHAALELGHRRSQYEHLARAHTGYCGVDFRFQCLILRFEIKQWHRHRSGSDSGVHDVISCASWGAGCTTSSYLFVPSRP